jgi:uncharacterized protein (DUF1501 family)
MSNQALQMRVDRRSVLRGFAGAAALGWAGVPRLAFASARTEQRLVVVMLRGGMDGLTAVPAYGDPDYAAARGELAEAPPGAQAGALRLDEVFALHRVMRRMHGFYRNEELVVVHAAASPYRERSHFDAQNVLEAGTERAFTRSDGWVGRALSGLGAAHAAGSVDAGIALGRVLPLSMRGAAPVATWSPSTLASPSADLLHRLTDLYADDPALARALSKARNVRALASDLAQPAAPGAQAPFVGFARAAGEFLRAESGPRIAYLESGGWDTHAYQNLTNGALYRNLGGLDQGLGALADALGPHWQQTVVVVATEFGRTVAVNGSRGTDHGTAGCAFVLGGAVRGGRVVADWPGLGPRALREGRDLRPTTDLRAVWKGVLGDHLQLSSRALERDVFPDSAAIQPIGGLVRDSAA